MKVVIVNFCGISVERLKAVGYEHNQIVEVDNPLDLVEKFFQADMAVAIKKTFNREFDFLVMVDSHLSAFKQR